MKKPILYRVSLVPWESNNHKFAVRYLLNARHRRNVRELLCGDWPSEMQIQLIQYLLTDQQPFIICFGKLDCATEWFRLYAQGEVMKLPQIPVTAGAR